VALWEAAPFVAAQPEFGVRCCFVLLYLQEKNKIIKYSGADECE